MPRRYRIVTLLGRGGFGSVYRAELTGDGGFTKKVALKVLREDLTHRRDIAGRLRDEGRMLGLVRHRAIVQVDSLVTIDERWAVVMELVDGVDLHRLIDSVGRVPVGVALEIAAELAGALHAAWTAEPEPGRPMRLSHRDVKPPNVQLTSAGEIKLLDFGVARADFAGREAETRALGFGTPEYMSPERFLGPAGPEGDVWAVGAVLGELITGEAFGRPNLDEDRYTLRLTGITRSVRELSGSEAVATLLGDCLAYDTERRPTARDLERRARSLAREIGGEHLRDWAERAVPEAARGRETETDALCGLEFTEQAGESDAEFAVFRSGPHLSLEGGGLAPVSPPKAPTQPPPVAPPPPSPTFHPADPPRAAPPAPTRDPFADPEPTSSRWPLVALGVVALALVGVGVMGFGATAWWWTSAEPEAPVATDTPPARVEVPPEPPPAEPAEQLAPTPTPARATPKKATAATPVVAPAPEPTRVAVEAVPATVEVQPPEPARVDVTGDASVVRLLDGAGKSWSPGSVPPGAYTVVATFPDGVASPPLPLTLGPGGAARVKCSQSFARCVQ
ncbi:MAG: protein kinase domain-containing protein [Myxococcota bacterium]